MPIPFLAAASVVSSLWGVVPGWAKIAMGGTVALFLTYQVGHWRGDNHRNAIWVQKIEAERDKQEKIVFREDAMALAANTKLMEEKELLDAQINLLLAEADKDANAARVCLGTPSLQRINRGR